MAIVKARNLHVGTQFTTGIFDTRRTQAREMLWVDAINNDLNSAIISARSAVPLFRNVGGVVVPLDTVTATYISNSKAMVAADYRFISNGGTKDCGFNRIKLSTGHESVQWYRTAIVNGQTGPGDPYFDAQGRPKGDIHFRILQDGSRLEIPYQRIVPVWHLQVRTTLGFNPAGIIKRFMSRQINRNAISWDGFPLDQYTVRFDGADILYLGQSYDVIYNFSLRGDGWYRQAMDRGTGRPVLELMYRAENFTAGGAFPVGPQGRC